MTIMRFLLAHLSSLSMSLEMASLPSSVVSALLNVMSSTNAMKKHSLISSGSLNTHGTGQVAGQTLVVPF